MLTGAVKVGLSRAGANSFAREGKRNHFVFSTAKRALVLACGNPHRGDDAVGLHVAKSLVCGFCDSGTEVHSQQQWLPEMAETISEANLVIFVDASAELSPGEVCTRLVTARPSPQAFTHSLSPEKLLALARDLYHSLPQEAYIISIGGESFAPCDQLSESVRHAIPLALEQVKAILSGVSVPHPAATAAPSID